MTHTTDGKGAKTMTTIICTMCGETMQYAGKTGAYESYWCEDCDIEGHINTNQAQVA